MTYVRHEALGSATGLVPTGRVVVMAVGDPSRGNGAVGLAVLERLAATELGARLRLTALGSEPSAVVAGWRDIDLAVVVGPSAVGTRPVGSIHHVEIDTGVEEAELMVGGEIAAAVLLGRAVGHLPRRLVLLTVEGGSFVSGHPLSPPVAQAVERVVAVIEAVAGEPSLPA